MRSTINKSTLAGGLSYAEDVNNVRYLDELIKPSLIGHEEEARSILSERFQKPIEVINEILIFGEYLNEDVLNTLAESKMAKRFFEKVQIVKRILIKDLRYEGLSDEKITERVSKVVLKMHPEYCETGTINTKKWQLYLQEDYSPDKDDESVHSKYIIKEPPIFKHWTGLKTLPKEYRVSTAMTNKEMEKVAEQMTKIAKQKEGDQNDRANKYKEVIWNSSKLYQKLLFLIRRRTSANQKGGV